MRWNGFQGAAASAADRPFRAERRQIRAVV